MGLVRASRAPVPRSWRPSAAMPAGTATRCRPGTRPVSPTCPRWARRYRPAMAAPRRVACRKNPRSSRAPPRPLTTELCHRLDDVHPRSEKIHFGEGRRLRPIAGLRTREGGRGCRTKAAWRLREFELVTGQGNASLSRGSLATRRLQPHDMTVRARSSMWHSWLMMVITPPCCAPGFLDTCRV